MNCNIDDNLNFSSQYESNTIGTPSVVTSGEVGNMTGWGFWQNYYYPQVIKEGYPVYIQEQAKEKGKHAFEIVKVLKDKKLIKLDKVSDLIDLMDELIKIL